MEGRDGSRSTSRNHAGRRLDRTGRPEVPVGWSNASGLGSVAGLRLGLDAGLGTGLGSPDADGVWQRVVTMLMVPVSLLSVIDIMPCGSCEPES